MTETSPSVWRLRVVIGYRPDGQPRQASKTVRGTKRTAQSALAKFVADAENGEAPLEGNMTVSAFLERRIEHVRAHRQPDTTRNYALRCEGIADEFGSVRLSKLRSHHLDEVYRRWLLDGLSPATIHSYHGVLSSALGQAAKWGLVIRSVAPLATLPTVEPRRMTVPDVDTVRLLVTVAETSDPVLGATTMLAALTGCRRGKLPEVDGHLDDAQITSASDGDDVTFELHGEPLRHSFHPSSGVLSAISMSTRPATDPMLLLTTRQRETDAQAVRFGSARTGQCGDPATSRAGAH